MYFLRYMDALYDNLSLDNPFLGGMSGKVEYSQSDIVYALRLYSPSRDALGYYVDILCFRKRLPCHIPLLARNE